jgi:hypothetical protein
VDGSVGLTRTRADSLSPWRIPFVPGRKPQRGRFAQEHGAFTRSTTYCRKVEKAWRDLFDVEMQAAYAGAAVVYARNQALAHVGKREAPGVARILTFTLNGSHLQIFAHHAASRDRKAEYHQYLVAEKQGLNTLEGFEEGRRWLRNM